MSSNASPSRLSRAFRLLVSRPRDVLRYLYRYVFRKLSDIPDELALGISTGKFITQFQDSERQIHRYEPVPYVTLRAIDRHMTRIGISAPRFADIGCGLGRPLFFFSPRFQELQGFELAESLVLAARQQMEQLQHRKAGFRNIEFVMADATTAVPLDRDLVVFLYNPFGPDLMTRLSEHLRASSVQIHIYYANPIHPDAIERIADSSEAIPGFIPVRYFHLRRQGQIRNSPRLVQR